jgi:hypothetical protein
VLPWLTPRWVTCNLSQSPAYIHSPYCDHFTVERSPFCVFCFAVLNSVLSGPAVSLYTRLAASTREGRCPVARIVAVFLTLLGTTSGSFASPRTNSLPAQHVPATMRFPHAPGDSFGLSSTLFASAIFEPAPGQRAQCVQRSPFPSLSALISASQEEDKRRRTIARTADAGCSYREIGCKLGRHGISDCGRCVPVGGT